jgi:hypothetical protein
MPKLKNRIANTKSNGEAQSIKPEEVLAANTLLKQELAYNAVMSRSNFVSKLLDPRRDIDDECGYPKTEGLTVQEYSIFYNRNSIAARVVEVLPTESWQAQPKVFETEDPNEETAFELAWGELDHSLGGEGWYKGEEGSRIWEYLQRVDVLSGIGHYGVVFLGFADGKDPAEPIEGTNNELLFVRVFDEGAAVIDKYEEDVTNPRYGQPVLYSVIFGVPTSRELTERTESTKVHWTRVIHVADNKCSSEVIGVPRMRPVYNRLYDLYKLYGGSAEMYWRGAFPGYSIETHPSNTEDVEFDMSELRAQFENWSNGLQRYFAMVGGTLKSLAPQVVDPTPQINTQIEAICVKLAVPKRIFTGSERGELASSQDARTWNSRLRNRQSKYITPNIIAPFVDRLIMLGVLPTPEEYFIKWSDLDSLSEDEQAMVAVKQTEALTKYVQGNVEALMTPMDYLTRIIKFTDEEAEEIIDSAMEAIPMLEQEEEEEFGNEGEEEFGEEEKGKEEEAKKKKQEVK